MFVNARLAARLDATEARFCGELARLTGARYGDPSVFVRSLDPGAAIYAGPGSPMNKLIGAAFGVVPDEALIASIERDYQERGVPFQAEVSTLAEPAFAQMLHRRGYVLQGYENLLVHPLGAAVAAADPALDVSLVEGEEAIAEWVQTLAAGFATPDVGGVGGDVTPPSDEIVRWASLTASAPGLRCYVVRVEGVPAGGGALYAADGVAMLSGASTLPPFRRRGIQTTLLRARLREAARAGCEYAMVTVQPGSKSQQNVQREGFALACSRALLVKEHGTRSGEQGK